MEGGSGLSDQAQEEETAILQVREEGKGKAKERNVKTTYRPTFKV